MTIVLGGLHSLFLHENGGLYTCGSNAFGQLGLPTEEQPLSIPRLIPSLTRIRSIAAGFCHSVCVDEQGKVWSFGRGENGELGLGDLQKRTVPTCIDSLPPINYVAAGDRHTAAIGIDHSLWVWGGNPNGQLGIGQSRIELRPTQHPMLVQHVVCAAGHTLLVDMESRLWGTGWNNCGQLGLGHCNDVYEPQKIPFSQDIADVASKGCFSLVLTIDGEVWSTGNNSEGQLGLGDREPRSKFARIADLHALQIACGYHHSLCIDDRYQLLSWGCSLSGQAGRGNDVSVDIPQVLQTDVRNAVAGPLQSIVQNFQGQLLSCGRNSNGELALAMNFGANITELQECLDEISFAEIGWSPFQILQIGKRKKSARS